MSDTGAPLFLKLLEPSQAEPEVLLNFNADAINNFAATGGGSDVHTDTGGAISVSDGTHTVADCVSLVFTDGLLVDEGGGVAHYTPPSGGGGSDSGGGWVQNIDEDGSSLSNFTMLAGTWSVSGSEIELNDNSGSDVEITHNTSVAQAHQVLQVTLNIPSSGQFNSSNQFAGLAFLCDGASVGNSMAIGFFMNNNTPSGGAIDINHVGTSNLTTQSHPFSLDTDYTLRAEISGNFVNLFVDGVLVLGYQIASPLNVNTSIKVGLYGHAIKAFFKNFKQWTLALPS